MVDFKKEIKLSDLVPEAEGQEPAERQRSRRLQPSRAKKAKKQRDRRAEDRRVAAGCGARRQQRLRPSSCSSPVTPLAPGIVVGGEVRDVAALGTALDDVLHRAQASAQGCPPRHRHEPRRCPRRSTSRGSTIRSSSGTPCMFRANETLSIPMDEAVLDYHVVSEKANEEGGSTTRRVVLAAAYREPVDHFVAACHAAALELVGIDVEAFAMLRAVAPKATPRPTTRARRDRRGRTSATTARPRDLERRGLRLHARPRVGRREARDRARPRSRPDRDEAEELKLEAVAHARRRDRDEDPHGSDAVIRARTTA